ncbi:MAG: ammonium transporter [Cytophagaceae bacterium]|jgi:Amt family ammonium transporter|nr:ammonium transporter [Cytophagaceae bacterium]
MATILLDSMAVVVDSLKDTIVAATAVIADTAAVAEAAAPDPMLTQTLTTSNVWMMVCTALVFLMHLGFATVETGLSRSKNTVNILFKNTLTPAIGLLLYAAWGFNLMYPGADYAGKFFGFAGFGIGTSEGYDQLSYVSWAGYTYWTDFLFQGMFAATAATIVSGAVAERIKIGSYLVFTVFLVGILYPIVGMWKWGGGWLTAIGGELPAFYDFAGSTLVHSVGGWAALAGVLVLGPRIGKYVDGKIIPIPGHSMPLAAIGVFLLWLGWFGFNGGSVLSADPALTSLVLVTTSLAAAAGAVGAAITASIVLKSLDLSMVLNGILGGLVGITAGADKMSPMEAIIIGIISGVIVVLAVVFFDKVKIDDPVGATSVHLVCGIFGTLVVGVMGELASMNQFISQLIGVAAAAVFVFPLSYIAFLIISKTIGLRVPAKEEIEGLDIAEHGMKAYNIDINKEY